MFSDQKVAIANAFGKACTTYDAFADFQREVGHTLMSQMQAIHPCVGTVLDVGCGTGYFSQLWLKHGNAVTGLDLSAEMVAFSQGRCPTGTFLQGDAERLPFDDNAFDVVFSSLALQWCDDLSVPLSELKRVLKPNGILGFTTLLDGSLMELNEVGLQVDGVPRTNPFISMASFLSVSEGVSGGRMSAQSLPWHLQSPNFSSVLRALKGIGANHLCQRSSGLMSRQKFRALEAAYEKKRLENGQLPVTYQVGFGVMVHE